MGNTVVLLEGDLDFLRLRLALLHLALFFSQLGGLHREQIVLVGGVSLLLNSLDLALLVDGFLVIVKLEVALNDVNVGGLQEAADFPDVGGLDLGVSVDTSHSFGEADQGLELSDGVPVGSVGILVMFSSKFLIFGNEHLCRLFGELRLQGAANLDVGLDLAHAEMGVKSLILESVHIDNMLGDLDVLLILLLVEDHEEEIKSTHNRGRDINVVAE